jgi:hypothetical protein
MGLESLGKQDVFRFLSYLFNLEDWVDAGELRGDTGVDRQVVQSPVSWESDHLRIGKRFQETPALYEVKDKKPSLINFDFANGLYTVPKEVDAGYLSIGKQRVDFHRNAEVK